MTFLHTSNMRGFDMLEAFIQWLIGASTNANSLPAQEQAAQSTSTSRNADAKPDIASLPRTQRLFMEQQVLAQRFPGFRWHANGKGARVEGTITTSSGRFYKVRAIVPTAFPFAHPTVFIISPIEGGGESLTQASHGMHTLSADSDGHPQLCLYNDRNWNPSLTVQHVLVKAAVWLEAFEQHCRTGRPVSDFLVTAR
jgi:ubiquitin-protein ligase